MRTSVLLTVLAVALVLGTACKGPDTVDETFYTFDVVARGANVLPQPADTTPRASAVLTGGTAVTVSYSSATTIDSIFLYQMGAGALNFTVNATTGATTYVAPSARVCGSSIGTAATGLAATLPSACAASTPLTAQPTVTTVNATTTITNTPTTISNSLRAYGTQIVFFSGAGAFYKRGTARGTPFAAP